MCRYILFYTSKSMKTSGTGHHAPQIEGSHRTALGFSSISHRGHRRFLGRTLLDRQEPLGCPLADRQQSLGTGKRIRSHEIVGESRARSLVSYLEDDPNLDTYLGKHLVLPDVLWRHRLASVLHCLRKVLTVKPLSAI
jgi:hypothetical protein